jgi:uncharacterized protein (TIGR03083 family)
MSLDYLAHLRGDSARFRAALATAAAGLRVPSCPDWDVDDLLWHLGEVQWFWGTIVQQRLDDPDEAEAQKPQRPGDRAGLLRFFDSASALLQRALAETDPSVEVWMWDAERTVGYVRRRQAHEALIHRLDAELTVGAPTPLDPELASDGVDEAIRKMFGGLPDWATSSTGTRTVSLQTADTGLALPLRVNHWSGTSRNTGRTYDDEPYLVVEHRDGFEPDVTVQAPAADLDAWLWGRAEDHVLTVHGDAEAFTALRNVITTGIS